MSDESATLYLDNRYTIRHALTGDDGTSGDRVPATGLTVTAMPADTQTATAPIHAELLITLTEVGATGEYIGTVVGDVIGTRLLMFVGPKVYEIVSDGASLPFRDPAATAISTACLMAVRRVETHGICVGSRRIVRETLRLARCEPSSSPSVQEPTARLACTPRHQARPPECLTVGVGGYPKI